MIPLPDFTLAASNQLVTLKFRLNLQPILTNDVTAHLAASRTVFSWKGLVLISQHVVISYQPDANALDLQKLFDAAFKYGKRVNRVPLLRGMQFGYIIIPCIVVDVATPEIIEYARTVPRKHVALFEFPVVHELSTNRTYFHQQTPFWGTLYFSDARSIVEAAIGPAHSSAIHPPAIHPPIAHP